MSTHRRNDSENGDISEWDSNPSVWATIGVVQVLNKKASVFTQEDEALLSALASCVSVDIVEILAKRRTPVESLEIDVVGERVDTTPRRYKHITLNFRITGKGIEKEQALRAIELSATRYCSVRDSLRTDIQVAWTVELQGQKTH